MRHTAQAWLQPGADLESDALTLSAYMGVGSLEPTIAMALAHGKGGFLLAATSNPEAAALQRAVIGGGSGKSVAAGIVEGVIARNRAQSMSGFGSFGVVIGATVDCSSYGIDRDELAEARIPILAPGFGHQGATFDQLRARYGAAAPSTVVSVSRSVLAAGPVRITESIAAAADEVARCLG